MPSTQRHNTGQAGLIVTDLSDNRKGDIAEIFVTNLALVKGAEVFRNAGCDGSIDLVLLVNGQFIPIDVKLAHKRKDRKTWKASTVNQDKSIYMVVVYPYHPLDMSQWEVSWQNTRIGCKASDNPKFRCPEGLEDFWDKDYFLTSTQPHEPQASD